MSKISDSKAKRIFLSPQYWPRWTTLFSLSGGHWIQCRPKRLEAAAIGITYPHLHTAGSLNFWIDPDCFYIRLSGKDENLCCDVIAVEVSNAQQNFQQKRGRYVGTESSIFANLTKSWLNMPLEKHKTCHEYLFGVKYSGHGDLKVPIRTLRILYFLDPDFFKANDRIRSIDARPWEYFLPNTSIRSLTSKSMRDFVRAISPDAQFYGWA